MEQCSVFKRGLDPDSNWAVIVPAYFASFAILMFVMLRLGLVAAIAAFFYANDAAYTILGGR
jgi:hypothetical protein